MKKMGACLWFDGQAEEAADFYVSTFKNAKLGGMTRVTDEVAQVSGGPAGSVMTVTFEVDGLEFIALNGGPEFKFNESISFVANCETQEEVDHLWEALSADGGEKSVCGWLKDRYGVSWQVVPAALMAMIEGGTPAQTQRVMAALLQMTKLDIEALRRAYDGR
jgi:predicted 3-demethylubiquinone-9 3-methyltransferase (glyoxalase superfamily)